MHELDTLVNTIATLSRTPGRATTSGARNDLAYDPVAAQIFEKEEQQLGVHLPHLLRRLYTEVGNGGFGPGYGLLSITPISPSDHGIAFFYGSFRAARNRSHAEWPDGIVPFAHWGDLILSCVDVRNQEDSDPPVVRFEPNMPKSATFDYLRGHPYRGAGMIPETDRLSVWFEDWIEGREMFMRPYNQS